MNNKKFKRFEFKYIIDNQKVKNLIDDLGAFVEIDENVDKLSSSYKVRSLYFDDKDYSSYHEKIDGLLKRYKFRIRYYPSSKKNQVFLEQKGRFNNLVYKFREQIKVLNLNSFKNYKNKQLIDYIIQNTSSSKVKNLFIYNIFKKNIKPVAIIDYTRIPYYSKFDSTFRLTIDSNLSVKKAMSFNSDYQVYSLIENFSVVELKFSTHIPSWFSSIIKRYSLRRVSISKICKGLEALGYVEDES